jgi:large subunit ribosomal protein L18
MATQGKKVASTKRAKTKLKIRKKISGTSERPRLSIFRSSKHTYAQLILDDSGKTVASASTLDKEVVAKLSALPKDETNGKTSTKSCAAARAVGLILAERAKGAKVSQAVFDRNGFVYCGRVKALADGAREGGLDF